MVRKVWHQLRREGIVVAGCTVERLMKADGMGTWQRRRAGHDLQGLVHYSDAGSHYTSIRYTERLAEAGARPSIGSVGDSYDNALAESIIGLFKTDLIHRKALARPGWCRTRDPGMGRLVQQPASD